VATIAGMRAHSATQVCSSSRFLSARGFALKESSGRSALYSPWCKKDSLNHPISLSNLRQLKRSLPRAHTHL
jgi:hypothetical protein